MRALEYVALTILLIGSAQPSKGLPPTDVMTPLPGESWRAEPTITCASNASQPSRPFQLKSVNVSFGGESSVALADQRLADSCYMSWRAGNGWYCSESGYWDCNNTCGPDETSRFIDFVYYPEDGGDCLCWCCPRSES